MENYINSRYLNYKDFVELSLMNEVPEEYHCFRCGKDRLPMTYLYSESYHLPCWNCISPKKGEKSEAIRSVIWNIKDFYDKILGDRYFQLYIVDDIYFQTTFPHDYFEFKSVLGKLSLPPRNEMWLLDWEIGHPKIISEENIQGIKVVNLNNKYNIESSDKSIRINEFEIRLPELIPYDARHHSRYSILNKKSDRKTKRLRLSNSQNCVKFYNTKDSNVKSIFRLYKDGEEIRDLSILSPEEYIIIKMSILRNKTYMRRVFEIVFEILENTNSFCDMLFLKNTITVDSSKSINLNIGWSTENKNNSTFINISII